MNEELQKFGEGAVIDQEGLKTLEKGTMDFDFSFWWIFFIAFALAIIFGAKNAMQKQNEEVGAQSGAETEQK